MEYDLSFWPGHLLLLGAAALAGWWFGRSDRFSRKQSTEQKIRPEYFKGLNYLINEQPDKAIEVFIRMLEVDQDTVETHFALGLLYRRRGEVDRAIRIHRNLVARTNLDPEQRANALLELGLDYMRSGLLDRAEQLFQQMLKVNPRAHRALEELLDIYQQEHDWKQAVIVAQRLQSLTGRDLAPTIAQFHCEQAEQLFQQENGRQALQLLSKALRTDPGCVRAALLQADHARRNDQPQKALRIYRRVERQAPGFLALVLPSLLECYTLLGKEEEFKAFLHHLAELEHRDLTTPLLLAKLLTGYGEREAAVRCLERVQQRSPDPFLVVHTLELLDPPATEDPTSKQEMELLRRATARVLEEFPAYQCRRCGFKGKSLHWRCLGCKNWGTVKPL